MTEAWRIHERWTRLQESDDRVPLGLTRHLAFAIAAAALGSAFQHGYNTGVVNAPQKLVEEFIEDTYKHRFEEEPGEGTVKFIFSIFVAIFCVGGMMGGLLTAFVAERFGRKGGLLLNNISVFLAAILMGASKSARSYEMLILGRFFVGLSSGLNAGLAPMYLTEISPLHLRGAVGTIYQLVVTISILASQILGLPSALGTADRWPALFAMTVVPSLFMLATLPLCPESPKYILINQGRDVAAQQALTWLRGTIEVHDEMDEMRAEFEAIKMVSRVTLYEMMHNITLRIPLLISIMVMLSQQLSGINAAIFFSTDIFRSAGLTDEVAMQATLGMGAVNVFMTLVSLVLVERAGRRTLHLVGLGGMAVITVILTICLALSDSVPGLSYVSIVAVIGFVVMFATGPGSIPLVPCRRALRTGRATACNQHRRRRKLERQLPRGPRVSAFNGRARALHVPHIHGIAGVLLGVHLLHGSRDKEQERGRDRRAVPPAGLPLSGGWLALPFAQ
ncbi:hypothetical protein HPB51_009281 [Rhipicephalus microplus]|uniref:Major facilitator superfamily (MFS) profile domain-containing protein n=1 Tax=Rhipicephalus microplus TaxID=6941 RepID=A0A9J6F0K7_RHIMP|nr:hypothetical protein HPB51_009281 [Rhipicephalus microplus]